MARRTMQRSWLERQVRAQAALEGISPAEVSRRLGICQQTLRNNLRAASKRVDAYFLMNLGEVIGCGTSIFIIAMLEDGGVREEAFKQKRSEEMAIRNRPMNWLERRFKAQASLADIDQATVALRMRMTPQAFYQKLARADSGRMDAGFLIRLGEAVECKTSVFIDAMEEDVKEKAKETD